MLHLVKIAMRMCNVTSGKHSWCNYAVLIVVNIAMGMCDATSGKHNCCVCALLLLVNIAGVYVKCYIY